MIKIPIEPTGQQLAKANRNITPPYPIVFKKSYTLGDTLPKNIAAEIYHATKSAVIKLNTTEK